MTFSELNPPYATIVADPPWAYDEGWPRFGDRAGDDHVRTPLPYSAMSMGEIAALPVEDLAGADAHLYLEQVRKRWQALATGRTITLDLECGHRVAVSVQFLRTTATLKREAHVFCGDCRQFEDVL